MKTPYIQIDSTSQAESKAEAEAVAGTGHSSAPACTPRTVIRGESFPGNHLEAVVPEKGSHPYAAHTDWLNCTFPLTNDPDFLNTFFRQFFEVAGNHFAPATELGIGLNGWLNSYSLGETSGKIGIGGQNNTVFLSLPAKACIRIALDAWPAIIALLENHYHARITRWDGAVDDFEGRHSVDWAVEQYRAKQFNAGGNKPKCSVVGDWLEPDGSGRTFNVGRRKNGKVTRTYEKGMQLGDPNSTWVRWEVELHNKNRFIPWDVLINPGQYVAGAHPCTKWVSDESFRVKTLKTAEKISYDSLMHHAKQAYGPLISVMMEKEGSAEKVVAALIRDGIPKRMQLSVPPEMHTTDHSDDD